MLQMKRQLSNAVHSAISAHGQKKMMAGRVKRSQSDHNRTILISGTGRICADIIIFIYEILLTLDVLYHKVKVLYKLRSLWWGSEGCRPAWSALRPMRLRPIKKQAQYSQQNRHTTVGTPYGESPGYQVKVEQHY